MANLLGAEATSQLPLPSKVGPHNRLLLACLAYRPALRRTAVMVVLRPGETFDEGRYIYFVESGIASVRCLTQSARRVEVGIAGPHSIVGIPSALFPNNIVLTIALTVCRAVRIDAGEFADGWTASPGLARIVGAFLSARLTETMVVSSCTASHAIEQRLARTLIQLSERLDGEPIPVTHQHLAESLSVRRASVTTALHLLEGEHAVQASRGVLRVKEIGRLYARACSCHRFIRDGYAKMERTVINCQPSERNDVVLHS